MYSFCSQDPDFIWVLLLFLLSLSCCPHVLAGAPAAILDLKVTSRMEASEIDGACIPADGRVSRPALYCLLLDFCRRKNLANLF
jgi:hypothetical protein